MLLPSLAIVSDRSNGSGSDWKGCNRGGDMGAVEVVVLTLMAGAMSAAIRSSVTAGLGDVKLALDDELSALASRIFLKPSLA